MGRLPEYERQKLIKSRGYDFDHKRPWPKSPESDFEPQSRLSFSQLKEKGRLFFRQALLEMIFGERQAGNDLPNDMPRENRLRMIEFLEADLRENLEWGPLYLRTKTETGIIKPDPLLEMPHSKPYEFIKTFKQRCVDRVLCPFREWEDRIKVAGFPVETDFSKLSVQKSIPASLALYLVIHNPEFPGDWPEIADNTIQIDKRAKALLFKGQKIQLQDALLNLAIAICNAGDKGLSLNEYEKMYQNLEDSDKTAPDYSKEVSRLNSVLEKALELALEKPDKIFQQIGGNSTPYRLNPQYKYWG